ncbi:hypothetical protein J2744_000542 [Halorubrum trapanicum]|uniref:Uncharacterized protein n=1 Tax=Halorubrum trapanicum TaxID=29284 RepID=A0A8J7R682_9EURY|nr:hypothetical protein [Halorubrum trapanicum]MBP1900884.1 hypothetical protein [Halorubrum trapanicum]
MTGVSGAISGFVLSVVVNLGSIWYQNRKRKEREQVIKEKEWYRDLLRTSRNLEREAYLIDPTSDVSVGRDGFQSDDPSIKQIDELLNELEGLVDKRPETVESREASRRISEIEAWHRRNQDGDSISPIDIKERIIDDSRLIKNLSKNQIPD